MDPLSQKVQRKNYDVGRKGRYTRNILQWEQNSRKAEKWPMESTWCHQCLTKVFFGLSALFFGGCLDRSFYFKIDTPCLKGCIMNFKNIIFCVQEFCHQMVIHWAMTVAQWTWMLSNTLTTITTIMMKKKSMLIW